MIFDKSLDELFVAKLVKAVAETDMAYSDKCEVRVVVKTSRGDVAVTVNRFFGKFSLSIEGDCIHDGVLNSLTDHYIGYGDESN